MFNFIHKELDELINRGMDRTLRIAVTGLSRSGKTAFITSFINQLLHINSIDNKHLPLFLPAQNNRLLGVKRVEQRDLSVPRFDYEQNMKALKREPASWFKSTESVSETRLAIRYIRKDGLMRHLKEKGTLYVEIFDYPGEWLLDLPLLDLDFQQWSLQQQELFIEQRQELAQNWLNKIRTLDLSEPANDEILAQLAQDYTEFLFACKKQGFHLTQPGRFVLPGELKGAPVLQFFPLVHLTEQEWKRLKERSKSDSYFAMLSKRYHYYQQKIVKGFYQEYFSTFDRQVILADCLTPLNHGRQAFQDMQNALQQLFKNFHYGKRTLFNRLFSPKIDKLMFIATKADHITLEQFPNLVSLMHQLVQEGGRYVEYEGIDTEYTAISAIRSTQQVQVTQNGQKIKALQGIRSIDKKKIVVYPGSVPSKLPHADFWQKYHFAFDQFEPLTVENGEPIAHLRMDAVLQFLLADKLD
ncbi:YcjX family protein [Histophilus somni]|uniref:YcjX family protein n=1 Tax=Histophilus somni TaxID=731 RepID=UPI00201F1779|nr:YcjX family protein [Histophilus somni]